MFIKHQNSNENLLKLVAELSNSLINPYKSIIMINRRQLLKSAGLLGLAGAGFGFKAFAENNNGK